MSKSDDEYDVTEFDKELEEVNNEVAERDRTNMLALSNRAFGDTGYGKKFERILTKQTRSPTPDAMRNVPGVRDYIIERGEQALKNTGMDKKYIDKISGKKRKYDSKKGGSKRRRRRTKRSTRRRTKRSARMRGSKRSRK